MQIPRDKGTGLKMMLLGRGGILDMIVFAKAFGNDYPPDNIGNDKGRNRGYKRTKDHRQPDDGRINIEHLAQAAAYPGNL